VRRLEEVSSREGEERGRRKEEGRRKKEEGRRRKEEGGRRKEERGRRKEEGGRRKEGERRKEKGGGITLRTCPCGGRPRRRKQLRVCPDLTRRLAEEKLGEGSGNGILPFLACLRCVSFLLDLLFWSSSISSLLRFLPVLLLELSLAP
jgi:hypothetical protein